VRQSIGEQWSCAARYTMQSPFVKNFTASPPDRSHPAEKAVFTLFLDLLP
jgi:hypothetical protein